MATCQKCTQKFSLFDLRLGLCKDCLAKEEGVIPLSINSTEREHIQKIFLTTETTLPDYTVKRIEVITAECAFGMNIFKDLFAAVRDVVGGRSEAVQKTLRDARKTVLFELKKEAYSIGADAVIGVDLDYVELSSAGSMIMLVASGTAVKLEPMKQIEK